MDPRHRDGKQRTPHPRPWSLHGYPYVWYRVEGWNDMPRGGACSYGLPEGSTEEQARAYRAILAANGDHEGRRYAHYDVIEMTDEVYVSQRTLPEVA